MLWDVIEEHVDEAEFLGGVWSRALVDPDYALDTLAEGPEARWLAHVEALVVAGPEAAQRVLWPLLEPDGAAHAMEPAVLQRSAALALLVGGAGPAAVAEAHRALPIEQREGIERAFALWDDPRVEALVGQRLRDTDDAAERVAWLGVAAARRLPLSVTTLDGALRDERPDVVVAGLDALAVQPTPPMRHLATVEALLQVVEPRVRDTAVEAGLRLGSGQAWDLAWQQWSRPEGVRSRELVALLGSASAQQAVVEWAQSEPGDRWRLWYAGLTGRVSAVELAMSRIDSEDPTTARLALEVVCAVAGLPADDPELTFHRVEVPDDVDEDEDEDAPAGVETAAAEGDASAAGAEAAAAGAEAAPADEPAAEGDAAEPAAEGDAAEPADDPPPAIVCVDGRGLDPEDAVDDLPLPRVEPVRAWWAARREGFDPRARYLYGQPYDLVRLQSLLRLGNMRRRHAWARELAARSHGAQIVITHLSSWVQRQQCAALTGLRLDLDQAWARR